MCLRALRIASEYLNEKTALTEQEVLNTDTFTEKQLTDAIQDALDTLYPTQIETWLRKLTIEELTNVMYNLVGAFNKLPAPKEQLSKDLIKIKNMIIKSIEEVAKSDDRSIKQNAFNYFKLNPTSNTRDVEDYVRKIMTDAKNRAKE